MRLLDLLRAGQFLNLRQLQALPYPYAGRHKTRKPEDEMIVNEETISFCPLGLRLERRYDARPKCYGLFFVPRSK